MFVQRTNY